MRKLIRIGSLLLIAIFFGSLMVLPSRAVLSDEDAARKGAEVFEAWNILTYSNYEYMTRDYVSPYRIDVEVHQDDPDWNAALAQWRILTFDIKSELTYAEKEVGYYNTFLFNILYDSQSETLGTSFVSTAADLTSDAQKVGDMIGASTWKKVCSVVSDISGNTAIDLMDTEKAEKYYNALKNSGDLKNAFSVIGDVTKYVKYASTALELVEKLSKIEALLQNTTETAEILSDLCDNCMGNLAMEKALQEYSLLLSGYLSEEKLSDIFISETFAVELGKFAAQEAWKVASSAFAIPAAGQSVGKFSADLLFGTSSVINNYYKIQAMYEFEDLIKAETLECESAFRNNPTPETAKKFIASFKLLYKTYLEGLDCTKEYFKAAMTEGLINKLFHHSKEDDYEKMVKSIESIKSSIQCTLKYIDTESYNFYLDVLSELDEIDGTSVVEDVQIEKLPETVTEPEFEIAFQSVKDEVFRFSDPVIQSDTTLTEDLETYGNYTLKGGTLNLNGHTLTVRGDLTVSGGTLDLNGGTLVVYGDAYISANTNLRYGTLQIEGTLWQTGGALEVNKGQLLIGGDYRFQSASTNSAGDVVYNRVWGTLIMQYNEDLVRIGGSFLTQSDSSNTFSAGTMEIAGDLRQLSFHTSYNNFDSTGSHTVVLNGTKPQNLSFCSSSAHIQNLQVPNPAGVIFSGYMNISSLDNDLSAVSNDISIVALDLNGHSLTLEGDVYIVGVVNLASGTLKIDGTLWQTTGEMKISKGQLLVSGDYRFQAAATNSAGETVYNDVWGSLTMQYDEDLVRIGGSFLTQSGSSNTFSAGTMEIAGDLRQLSFHSSYNNFDSTGSHTVVLNGTKPQNLNFCSSNAHIQNLQVPNPTGVIFSGYINIGSLKDDFSAVSNRVTIVNMDLNGHSLTLEGDVYIVGAVNLASGTLKIDGTLWQTTGEMKISKGQLLVSGDYRFQAAATNSAGETVYNDVWGILTMQYDEDLVRIGGSFLTQSGSVSTLSAGTMEIAGDLRQLSVYANDNNFNSTGTHTVVLNGTGHQTVSFCSTSSRIQNLRLTQDGTHYTFNPDPCWNNLIEVPSISDVEVTGISLSARSHTMTVGQTFQLTAMVHPDNATDPTLTWSTSNPEVVSVTQEGLVTALSEGSAVITATASNGLYRTCAVTINKITSGVLTVGTVNALPGNKVIVPVTVWDNPGFAALRVSIAYDESMLTFVGANAGEALPRGELTAEAEGGICHVLWYDTADADTNGVLFYLEFLVSEQAAMDQESDLNLSYQSGDICTSNHANVDFFTENGAVLVRDIQKGDIYEDGVVDAHDILLLQQHLTGLAAFSDREKTAADLDSSGVVDMKDIVLLAQRLVSISGNQLILQNPAYPDGQFQVCVGDAIFSEDGYADVPVIFSGCPGIAAFRFQIHYDDTFMELVDIQPTDGLGDAFCSNLEDMKRTTTLVTWYSPEDQAIDGTVLTLRFRLKDENLKGLLPVSLSCPGADLCTAALQNLIAEMDYGVIRTVGYSADAQIAAPMVYRDGDSGTLTAPITCSQAVAGEAVRIYAAFYGENGQFLTAWTSEVYQLENGTVELQGILPDYQSVKVFLLADQTLISLCEAAVN